MSGGFRGTKAKAGNEEADALAKAGANTATVRARAGEAPEGSGQDRRYALRPRSRPPNNNDNRHEEVTVARLRRIVREKAAAAFKSWWERAAPACYKELGIQLASGCPPELELTRATLHRLLAARSGHGDFAEYHERFEHEDAVLECSCGKRNALEHLLLCDKVRTRD